MYEEKDRSGTKFSDKNRNLTVVWALIQGVVKCIQYLNHNSIYAKMVTHIDVEYLRVGYKNGRSISHEHLTSLCFAYWREYDHESPKQKRGRDNPKG